MEKFESRKKIPDIEIHFLGQAERRKIIEKFESGVPVMFILTKSHDLYLGSGGHEDIRFTFHIQWEDELPAGVARYKDGAVSIRTYDKISEDIEQEIIRAVKNFLGNSL